MKGLQILSFGVLIKTKIMKAKNVILAIFFSGIVFSLNAQIKFYSEGKEVQSIDKNADDLKVEVVLSQEALAYPEVEININDYGYRYLIETKGLEPGFKKEIWIMKPSQKSGQLCFYTNHTNYCFNPMSRLDDISREYEKLTLTTHLMGRKISKYYFNDQGEHVPKYYYQELNSENIEVQYGPVVKSLSSTNNVFTTEKAKINGQYSRILTEEDNEILDHWYITKENDELGQNSVRFRIRTLEAGNSNATTFDMSGGASSPSESQKMSVDLAKKSIEINLMRSSDSRSTRYIEEEKAGYYWNSSYEFVYEPLLLPNKNRDPGEKDFVKHFESAKKDLNWKPGKVGNLNVEVLEIEVYFGKQVTTNVSNHNRYVKEGEEGKVKKVMFFVGEKNGNIIAGSIHREGMNPMNEDEKKFWNYMISEGITVN